MIPDSTTIRNDPVDMAVNSGHSVDVSVHPPTQMDTEPSSFNAVHVRRSRRRRSGVNYGMLDMASTEEADCEQTIQVSQRWHPEDACRPIIDEAPIFHPTEEEFKDTLAYIAKIRHDAENYGICRIIPPPSWKPPCPLKEKSVWDCAKFTTRIQQIDKLQNRDPAKKKMKNRDQRRRKRRRRFKFGMTRRRASSDASEYDYAGSDNDEKFGFQSGSEFSLRTFKEFADHFKKKYFLMDDEDLHGKSANEGSQKRWEPTVEEVEGEYWRIVEKSTEEIEVHYGADLETGNFSSGFLKPNQLSGGTPDPYALSGWNLNNFPRLSGSLLSLERCDISGVLVPWLYIGMCFSSFCWHVEDHHLYSLNYMHFGDPKVWYGVAGNEAVKLEEAMKKHLPELFEEQPHLLNELVTQLSPSVLKSEGVPVYRAVQKAGEFLLTFPRAYHAGFNCGFNCAEAVNVAPVDWLPHGQCAVDLYSDQCRKTSLSHDKLLVCAALEAVNTLSNSSPFMTTSSGISKWIDFCGKDGMLTKAFKERILMEKKRTEGLPIQIQSRRMGKNFDSDERECISCFYDLYLSATGCECSPNRFTCVNHMKLLCSCEPSRRLHLFRYDLTELKTFVEALEGDTDGMKKWTSETPCIPKVMQVSNSDEPRSPIVFGMEDCSRGIYSRTSVPKANSLTDKEFFVCSSQDQVYDYDHHEQKEIILPKESEICEKGVLKVDKLNYQESGEGNCDRFVRSTFSTSFDADGFVNCGEDEGKINKGTTFDLNLDGTSLDSEEMLQPLHDGNEKEQCVHTCMPDTMVKEEQFQICNSLGETSSLLESMKDNTSNGDVTPINNLLWVRNHVPRQGSGSNLTLSPIPSSGLASSEIFHTRISSSLLQQGSAINCHKTGGSMLFGFNLLPQHQDQSPSDSTNGKIFSSLASGMCASKMDSVHGIELLELGTVVPGKLWCNKKAIFPKGFKSRIEFINVLDPYGTCNYISEVLPGVPGPLFKVTVEKSPDVSFVSTSATSCWELIRRTLEEKLLRCRSEGRNPFSVQALSINGLEMFGFLYQPIIQAIEGLDPHRSCTEYWAAKVVRRPELVDAIWPSRSGEEADGKERTDVNGHQLDDARPRKLFGVDLWRKEPPRTTDPNSDEVGQVLGGLIRKASPHQLDMLQDIFCTLPSNNRRGEAFGKLLMEAKRRRFSYSGSCS